ncbi:shikimate dehydrogenase [Salininema proteolyticum]|uniref:Shikimate dehydrogenase n=1 Tax=Salininema proteolyticum TaxID=1607685 RepID=A0ABV8TZK5_9ACTN
MRAAVLGKPVGHSLSPVIHNAGYRAAGLEDWSYTKHECGRGDLAAFVDGLGSEWAGLSLTMPLKEVALEVADEVTPTASALGAANTFLLREGSILADNTDAPGLVDALREAGLQAADSVAVIGAGGTARAALAAAAALGAGGVDVFARRAEAVADLEDTAGALGVTVTHREWAAVDDAASHPLVVSTVPKGVTDEWEIPWQEGTTVFDVVYDPRPTPLLRKAASRGAVALDGLALLLHQAVRQWTLFTGLEEAPVEAMRKALYAEAGATR